MLHPETLSMWARIHRAANAENLVLCIPGQDNRGRTTQCYLFETEAGAAGFTHRVAALTGLLPLFFYFPHPKMIAIRFAEHTVERMAHAAMVSVKN